MTRKFRPYRTIYVVTHAHPLYSAGQLNIQFVSNAGYHVRHNGEFCTVAFGDCWPLA